MPCFNLANGELEVLKTKRDFFVVKDVANFVHFDEVCEVFSNYYSPRGEIDRKVYDQDWEDEFAESVFKPRHNFVFMQSDYDEDQRVIKNIVKYLKEKKEYIDTVFLLGSQWLDYDEYKIPKSSGEINYIVKDEEILKVIIDPKKIKNIFDKETQKDFSWFWTNDLQRIKFLLN